VSAAIGDLPLAHGAPALQLPWPTGDSHRIDGGNSYNCGDHTGSNQYAIDFQFGVDGSPLAVSATAGGTVSIASLGYNNGAGNYIAVDHGSGYVSRYLHLQDTFAPGIAVGVYVSQGQTLGNADNSGFSTGTHLHFDVKSNGSAYMPEPMSGVTGFGQYGACTGVDSPYWTSQPPVLGDLLEACSSADSWSSGRLDTFAWWTDNTLKHKAFSGTWQPWDMPAHGIASAPSAVSWGPGRIDAFVRGPDNHLWQAFWPNPQNQWQWYDLGGDISSAPSAVSWGLNRLDIFARGSDNTLRHIAFDPAFGWGPWDYLGGSLSSAPSAVSWAPGRLDTFVQWSDGTMKHISFSGAWGPWDMPAQTIASAPSAASWASGRLDAFARGPDGSLRHIAFSGTWGLWENLGGTMLSSPSAVSWGSGRLDIFVRWSDNTMKHKAFASSWQPWDMPEGTITSAPSAVSWSSGRLDAFARGSDNTLRHIAFDTSFGWGPWENLAGTLSPAC